MISIEFVLLLIGLNYLRRLILITRHMHSTCDSSAWDIIGRILVWLMVVGATAGFVAYASFLLRGGNLFQYLLRR